MLRKIQSKKDLQFYLNEDLRQFHGKTPGFKDRFFRNESWYIYSFKKHLRYSEYYLNTKNGITGLIKTIPLLWHYWNYKRLSHKLKFVIMPNTTGPGLCIHHIGDFTHIRQDCSIGRNCTITVGTVFGLRKGGYEPIVVGDNCYFGIGAKILGSVRIGNNVKVGAYSIVTNDIPDNCIVVGQPARVIKRQNPETGVWEKK